MVSLDDLRQIQARAALPDRNAASAAPPTQSTAPLRSNAHILVVDQSGQLGGAELALLPLLEAWGPRCHTVLFADGPFRDAIAQRGLSVSVLDEPGVSRLKKGRTRMAALFAIPAMWRQIRALAEAARDADVLYLNTQKALVLGGIAGLLARRPVVWHAHDIMNRTHFGRLQLAIARRVLKHCVQRIIANSQASADACHALLRTNPNSGADSIQVLHNGLPGAPFDDARRADRASLRRALQLPEHAFVAGLFGRLAHWKGAHVALEAAVLTPNLHLLIVGAALFGEQDYEKSLRQRVIDLGLRDRVHFLGFRNDIPPLMHAVDAVLHTSIAPEPFGRVVAEGMLAGRPVIATAAGGVLEMIRHRETGLLIAPNDPFAIADALAALISSPAWAQRMGNQAAEFARKQFSLEAYVRAVTLNLDRAAEPAHRAARSDMGAKQADYDSAPANSVLQSTVTSR